jgi:hypothetical protein
VHPAGHKDRAVGEYEVLVAATDQFHDGAVGRNGLAKQLERLHECDIIGEKKLSKNGPR